LKWLDEENNQNTLDCYFPQMSENYGKSKGLYEIAKELGVVQNNQRVSLPNLRDLLRDHPAFKTKTKLELLADKYNVKIIYLPKFHCEMNPIEGFWAYQKQYVRRHNKQTNFDSFRSVFNQARDATKTTNLNEKLWRRFWRTIQAYKDGLTYGDILKLYFGSKSKENVLEHRRIALSNLN
jgi:transposase